MKNLSGPEKFAAQKIFETVEKIFQHIQLSISFYITQSGETGLDKIILTGGSAGMNNFKDFIEESLEVSTSLANPFLKVKIGEIKYDEQKLEVESPALSPVLGVALYKGEPEIINFVDILFPNRKSQSVNIGGVSSKFGGNISAKLFELDEKKLRIIAGLLAALLILLGLYPVVKIRQQVTKTKDELKKLNAKLAQLNASQSDVQAMLAEQEKMKQFESFPNEVKRLKIKNAQILVELASMTPRQIFLTNAEFVTSGADPNFKLQGHADNSDSVFEFLSDLGKSQLFHSPALESTQEVPIDDTRYFIRFVLNGKIYPEKLTSAQSSFEEAPVEEGGEDVGLE